MSNDGLSSYLLKDNVEWSQNKHFFVKIKCNLEKALGFTTIIRHYLALTGHV